jgi:hypothetical protein
MHRPTTTIVGALSCGLVACASPSVDDDADVVATTSDAALENSSSSATSTPEDPPVDSDTSTSTSVDESDAGGSTDAGDAVPTDGWFAATTRVIFYANHYGAISAHGLAITNQLATAPGLVDYTFDFELQSGRAQSISLWESELDFWTFVMGAAHAKAMVELNDPVAGRDFSYATWWVDVETLPNRVEADDHLGTEPMPGPYPVD